MSLVVMLIQYNTHCFLSTVDGLYAIHVIAHVMTLNIALL